MGFLSKQTIAAIRAAVVFVLGDEDHVVAFRAAAGGIVGGGPVIVGADVNRDGKAADVEDGARDRAAAGDLPVLPLAAVVAESGLIIVRAFVAFSRFRDRVVDAGGGEEAAVGVLVRRPADIRRLWETVARL